MRPIPEIRADLLKLADDIEVGNRYPESVASELRALVADMHRNKSIRRAAPRTHKVTPEVVAQVLLLAERRPQASQLELGNACGVNPGRVSEILNGKRTVENADLH